MQNFKGDATELKFREVHETVGGDLSTQKSLFFEDAYECAELGSVLYDSKLAPLTNAIPREIFRTSFATIFNQFLEAGSAESYIYVFKKIFGDDVDITFTVPAPGKLTIEIEAQNIEESLFVTRYVVDNAYVFDEIIDDEGDNIVFQTIVGFQSQYELEQMLFEMVPAGIFTTITLTLG